MVNKFFKILYIFTLAVIFLLGGLLVILSFFQLNFLRDIFDLSGENLIRLRLGGTAIIFLVIILLIYSKKIIVYITKIYLLSIDSLRKTPKLELLTLILILAVSLFLRIIFINRPITYSEAFSFMNYSQKSVGTGIAAYSIYNQPLNTIIIHIFYKLFGSSIWILRIPALISGFLLVLLTYIFGSVFYNKKTALVAASFTAIMPILLNFSVNLMGYSLFALIGLLVLLLAKDLKKNYRFGMVTALIIFSVMGLYITPVMIYLILTIVIWLIFSWFFANKTRNKKIIFAKAVGYFVSTIIIYFFLVNYIGLNKILTENFRIPGSTNDISNILIQSLPEKLNFGGLFVLGLLGLIIFVGFISYIIFNKKIEENNILPIILIILIVPFIFLVKNGIALNFLLMILPVLIVISSSGLVYILNLILSKSAKKEFLLIPVFSIILIVFGALFYSTGFLTTNKNREILADAESITKFLNENLKPGDKVLANIPTDYILRYYFFENNVADSYFLSYLKPTNNLYLIINKNFENNVRDSIITSRKNYLQSVDLNNAHLEMEYNSADIYLINNLNYKNNLILDYRSLATGTYINMELSSDEKSIVIKGEQERVNETKSCKIPVKVEAHKDYLITFEIMMIKDLTQGINFYFYSPSYNNDSDNRIELTLEPTDINNEFKKIEKIISIGQITNPKDHMRFMIDTKGYGEVIIRNPEIYEIDP